MRRVVHLLVCDSCRAESPEARSGRQAVSRARVEGWGCDPDLCPECPQPLAEVIQFDRPTHVAEVHADGPGWARHRVVSSWPATEALKQCRPEGVAE